MILVSAVHLLFVLSLFAVAAAAWWPTSSGSRWLPIAALVVWSIGVFAVSLSFQTRGQVWLAHPVRTFRFELEPTQSASLADHHKLLQPAPAMRLPRKFDELQRFAQLQGQFTLNADGSVTNPRITQSSGLPAVDAATRQAVEAWRFGAIPPGFPSARSENVTFSVSNRYGIFNRRPILLAGFFMVVWMGIALLLPAASQDASLARARGVNLRRFWTATGFLAGLGWLMLWRLAPDVGQPDLPAKQAVLLLMGMALAVATALAVAQWREFVPLVRRFRLLWAALCVLLLGLTAFTPLGTDQNTGHKLWLRLPALPALQTVELVKLLLLFFVAASAYSAAFPFRDAPTGSEGGHRWVSWLTRYKSVAFGFVVVFFVLARMRDFGPVVLLSTMLILLLGLQGLAQSFRETPRIMALLAVGVVTVVTFLWVTGQPSRFWVRWHVWSNPWQMLPADTSFASEDARRIRDGKEQMCQVFWGVSSGGLLGAGLGQGQPERVENVQEDFAFAVVAEELGWLGGAAVLLLLLALVSEGLRIAEGREDATEKTLALGLALLVCVQTFITVAGSLGVLPLTGITLPFLSYGGSSLLINFVAFGLLVGLSRRSFVADFFPTEQEGRLSRALPQLRLVAVPALFAILLAKQSYLQSRLGWNNVARAPRFDAPDAKGDRQAFFNPRLDGEGRRTSTRIVRGRILDRDGGILAETTPQGRLYSHRDAYLPIVGAEMQTGSGQVTGRLGLEESLQAPLTGRLNDGGVLSRLPTFSLEQNGFDVALTLDPRLQERAYELLEKNNYKGCIVGIEPDTGEVLIAVSRPVFDADTLTPSAWETAFNGNTSVPPLPYRRTYAPGSTFKTLIAGALLEDGLANPNSRFRCNGSYLPPGASRPIRDSVPHGSTLSLHGALEVSCNATFARLGVESLGITRLQQFAHNAGFDRPLPLLPDAWNSRIPLWVQGQSSHLLSSATEASALSPIDVARTSIGQYEVRMTPLHLALWTAAVANGGRLMKPSLVHTVTTRSGRTLWNFKSQQEVLSQPMSEKAAGQLTEMMEGVVERGTGRPARVPGLRIAGKTGTPQLGLAPQKGDTNAAFIAFAPVEHPRLALAIIIEDESGGGRTAGPLAAELFRTAFLSETPGGKP